MGKGYSPLLECPCTPQRVFDVQHDKNPSCFMDIYESGFRCCEHGVFVIDTDKYDVDALPETTFYFKFTFEYVDDTPATVPVRPPACCDVTANLTVGGNIEYDVPLCTPGISPEDCVHEMTPHSFSTLCQTTTRTRTSKRVLIQRKRLIWFTPSATCMLVGFPSTSTMTRQVNSSVTQHQPMALVWRQETKRTTSRVCPTVCLILLSR